MDAMWGMEEARGSLVGDVLSFDSNSILPQRVLWIRLGGACQDKVIGFHPGNQPENVKTFSYQQLEWKYLQVGEISECSKMIYSIEKLVEMENTEREAQEEAEMNVNGEGSRGAVSA